jgi:hypothetical protein
VEQRLGGGQERFDECYMQIDDIDEEIKRKDNHKKKKKLTQLSCCGRLNFTIFCVVSFI